MTSDSGFGPPCIDTPAANWHNAVEAARADGYAYFDFLTAVDNESDGIDVVVHLMRLGASDSMRDQLLRTSLPADALRVASVADLFAGAGWHEREVTEMFGVTFDGHPDLSHLLLPEDFDGHPLRKDFALAARNESAWPGLKDPTKDRR